jgi:hypothetical protein
MGYVVGQRHRRIRNSLLYISAQQLVGDVLLVVNGACFNGGTESKAVFQSSAVAGLRIPGKKHALLNTESSDHQAC